MGAELVGGGRCEGKDRLAGTGRTVNVAARLPAFLSGIRTVRFVVVKHSVSLSGSESWQGRMLASRFFEGILGDRGGKLIASRLGGGSGRNPQSFDVPGATGS